MGRGTRSQAGPTAACLPVPDQTPGARYARYSGAGRTLGRFVQAGPLGVTSATLRAEALQHRGSRPAGVRAATLCLSGAAGDAGQGSGAIVKRLVGLPAAGQPGCLWHRQGAGWYAAAPRWRTADQGSARWQDADDATKVRCNLHGERGGRRAAIGRSSDSSLMKRAANRVRVTTIALDGAVHLRHDHRRLADDLIVSFAAVNFLQVCTDAFRKVPRKHSGGRLRPCWEPTVLVASSSFKA